MKKTSDELTEFRNAYSRLVKLLEQLEKNVSEPEEDESSELLTETGAVSPDIEAADRVLEVIRGLRPEIERSGNRKTIDAYNRAILFLRNYGKTLRKEVSSTQPVHAADQEFRRRVSAESSPDAYFGEQARLYHRRSREEGKQAVEQASEKRREGTNDSEKSFEELAREHRNRMLAKR